MVRRSGADLAAPAAPPAPAKRGSRIRNAREDRVFFTLDYALLTFAFVIVIYPLIYIVSSSFSDAREVLTGRVWLLPINPNLDGYKAVFEYGELWLGYGNSIFYTVFGTLYNVAMTMIVAYPLSRKDFVGRSPIMFLFTFTMFFHGGLIPTYLLIKSLGMIDTRAVLIIPWAIGVWNVIITRTYLQSTVPGELYEAARVDGASNTRMFWHIVLPLSGPIIAVITLFYAVNHWNTYFNALIFIRNDNLRPLQLILREILIQNSMNILDDMMADMTAEQLEQMTRREFLVALLQYAVIVVATVPVLVMYPFVQKHFVKGVMIGSIKRMTRKGQDAPRALPPATARALPGATIFTRSLQMRSLAILMMLAAAAAMSFAAGEGEATSSGDYALNPPGTYPVVEPTYEFDVVTIYLSHESSGRPGDSKFSPSWRTSPTCGSTSST